MRNPTRHSTVARLVIPVEDLREQARIERGEREWDIYFGGDTGRGGAQHRSPEEGVGVTAAIYMSTRTVALWLDQSAK